MPTVYVEGIVKVLRVLFQILKPQCTGCYLYQENRCEAGTCPDPGLVDCTSGNFCPSAAICSPACTSATRYTDSSPKVNDYIVVASISHNVDNVGYNFFTLTPDQQVEIKKGYILGFESAAVTLAGILAGTGQEDFTTTDSTNVGDTVSVFTSTASKRHLLKAVVNKPVSIRMKHSYTTNALFTVQLKVENNHISTPPQIASTNISIGNGIDNIILNTSACFETSQDVQVEIMPHGGK